jgi:homoserine O-acetyltransferase
MGIWSDVLYPKHQQEQICRLVSAAGTPCEYLEIDSVHGHDAFLIDVDQVGTALSTFLNDVEKRS